MVIIPAAAWPKVTVHLHDLITMSLLGSPPAWYQVDRIDHNPDGTPSAYWCRPIHLDLPA
jgi:hypothetical protein